MQQLPSYWHRAGRVSAHYGERDISLLLEILSIFIKINLFLFAIAVV